jgi:hypothetical protein
MSVKCQSRVADKGNKIGPLLEAILSKRAESPAEEFLAIESTNAPMPTEFTAAKQSDVDDEDEDQNSTWTQRRVSPKFQVRSPPSPPYSDPMDNADTSASSHDSRRPTNGHAMEYMHSRYDTNADTYANRHYDTNADTYANRHYDTNADTYANRHYDTNADVYANRHYDTNADTYAGRHHDTYANHHYDTCANRHYDTNADTYANL